MPQPAYSRLCCAPSEIPKFCGDANVFCSAVVWLFAFTMRTLVVPVLASLRLRRGAVTRALASVAPRLFPPFLSNQHSVHSSARLCALRSQRLSDIGEGTTE